MLESIHAGKTASITEFKKNPQALIDAAQGEAIALLEPEQDRGLYRAARRLRKAPANRRRRGTGKDLRSAEE